MSANVLDESALRVSDCVTGLLQKQPFFGSLVLRLPLRADPTRQTLATDGQEIRVLSVSRVNSPGRVAKTAFQSIIAPRGPRFSAPTVERPRRDCVLVSRPSSMP